MIKYKEEERNFNYQEERRITKLYLSNTKNNYEF